MLLDHVQSSVSDLGEQLEIEGLALDENGSLNLLLDEGDSFGLDAIDKGVLVTMALVINEYELNEKMVLCFVQAQQALKNGFQLNIGLRDADQASPMPTLLLTRMIPHEQVVVDSLYETFELLWEARQSVKLGG